MTPGRSLTGRVVNPHGRPLPGVVVHAWSGDRLDRSTIQYAETDANGAFVVNGLWPPPWHVEAYTHHRDAPIDPARGVAEVRVLYPGTFDDSGPVELVLDVPGAPSSRDGDGQESP